MVNLNTSGQFFSFNTSSLISLKRKAGSMAGLNSPRGKLFNNEDEDVDDDEDGIIIGIIKTLLYLQPEVTK